MDAQTWLGIIGIIIAILQTVMTLSIRSLRNDIKDIWGRVNTHGHDIDCPHDTCKPRTAGVILHERG